MHIIQTNPRMIDMPLKSIGLLINEQKSLCFIYII